MSEATPDTFYGPFRVLGLEKTEYKTPSEKEIVKVLFENGKSQFMPLASFLALKSSEAVDFTTLGDKKVAIVRDAIIATIMEHDATALELQTILNRVSTKVSDAYDRAAHFLLTQDIYGTGSDETWVPGGNFAHYRTVGEIHTVLMKVPQTNGEGTEKTDTK